MEYRDFVYWLQGYFELGGSQTLNKEQVKKVYNHLKMTFKYNEKNEKSSKARDFAFWLDGVISQQSEGLILMTCPEIARRLNNVFEHEIDPSMPDPTKELTALHTGPKWPTPPPGVTYRC